MDYAGLDYRNIRFPVNRALAETERASRYDQAQRGRAKPMDFFSVVRFNSNYMDLVDRWYPIKGFNAWLGACVLTASIGLIFAMYGALFFSGRTAPMEAVDWVGVVGLTPLFLCLAWAGWWLIRTECGRYTHYPIRLDRKSRKVHFFRQNGTVLTVPWDTLFLTLGQSKSPLVGTTHDLRAHVLGEDGETVLESFSLGYTFPGNMESMDKFWAFLQPYMEAEDGIERTHQELKQSLLMPVDGRREGWRWSIFRTFAPGLHYPWTMLLLCIPLGLNAVGRMLAMSTSKIPQWPEEVERANPEQPDDPYRLTWRDNGPLGWWELYWPLLCTVIGVGAFVGALGWIVSGLWR
ncbi:DUF6708 domain-containing protein [Salinicola acroporae]|uniref:DUF6708 domain-containing protein n=1 Tax=Salinicola acroporae TaxID=1541440 RepID=UPI0013A61020|nr:DUF6708 domain-containing protein [Salinicola acroporae]